MKIPDVLLQYANSIIKYPNFQGNNIEWERNRALESLKKFKEHYKDYREAKESVERRKKEYQDVSEWLKSNLKL